MSRDVQEKPRNDPASIALAWTAVAGWTGVIFYMSSRTGISVWSPLTYVAHFTEYLVLGLLLCHAVSTSTSLSPRAMLLVALIVASLYGVSDEIHQAFVPTRQPDVVDWLTDSLGAGVALLLFTGARRARLIARP